MNKRIALVTGGIGGLGTEICKHLARSGRTVVACDLASRLMDLALDNRWGLPPEQCDLPTAIVAAPSVLSSAETDYDTWIVSFTQNFYLGLSLLKDPAGMPPSTDLCVGGCERAANVTPLPTQSHGKGGSVKGICRC